MPPKGQPRPTYDIAQHAQALTLLYVGATFEQITEVTGISERQVRRFLATAKERRYDPSISGILKDEYLQNAPRTGRPPALNAEQEEELVQAIRLDRYSPEKSSLTLGVERKISASTVQRIFKRQGIHKLKPTCKSGLTAAMKAARLKFCQDHKDWTLEDWKDWKNVTWTDETSVCLGHRRGSVRVWRTKQDRYDPTVVRPRWHGASEFMFWGCFSYDKKGPCHIWKPETEIIISKQFTSTLRIKSLPYSCDFNTSRSFVSARRAHTEVDQHISSLRNLREWFHLVERMN